MSTKKINAFKLLLSRKFGDEFIDIKEEDGRWEFSFKLPKKWGASEKRAMINNKHEYIKSLTNYFKQNGLDLIYDNYMVSTNVKTYENKFLMFYVVRYNN